VLNHVIFCEHYISVAIDIFWNDNISEDSKLYLSSKHVTLIRLLLPSTLSKELLQLCQHSDTALCNIIWSWNKTHT
jgi:hypothetical protein